jgi:hypothetical protein
MIGKSNATSMVLSRESESRCFWESPFFACNDKATRRSKNTFRNILDIKYPF